MWPFAIAIFGVAGCAALVAEIIQRGPWPLFAMFLLGVGWMAYNSLRASYELVVSGEQITWRSFVGKGQVLMSDVVSVRSRYSGSVQVFECADGTRFRVAVLQGYRPFIEAVARAHPNFPASVGRYARLVDRTRW